MLKKTLLVCVLAFCSKSIFAQDTIPTNQEVDTTLIDTIVIRSFQYKTKIIPRGANLTNPIISFKKTKPLTKEHHRFRVPSFWQKTNNFGLNLSEVAFVNWNAGGNNSVSAIGSAKFERNYKFRYVQWDNEMELRYGANAQEGRKLRKADDVIRLSSTFGYRRDTISNWYYSVKANFNSQFTNGYKYPDRDHPISRFMAPGYAFLGAGTSYIPEGKKFNLYISPLTLKSTFVLDPELANKGAFGVKKAVLDADGNVLQEGENTLVELGFLINNTWETKLYDNITLNHRLSLYTDYLHSFGNIDVDWEMNLILKVNKFVRATIGTHILFDDDIKFDEEKAADGTIIKPGKTRIQFKQLLGVGIKFDL